MPQPDIPAHRVPPQPSGGRVRPRINLGGDPGSLIASIPALLGFTPRESLVVVGLYDAGEKRRIMRIGPVVRADLNYESLSRALATMLDALDGLPSPEVVLVAVSEDQDSLPRILDVVIEIVEEEHVGINGVHTTTEILGGVEWCHRDGSVGGTIGDTANNELRTMGKCSGALHVETKEQRDEWLNPVAPRLSSTPMLRFYSQAETNSEALDLVTDVGECVKELEAGHVSIEDLKNQERLLTRLAMMCMDIDLHAVVVLFAQGMVNPAIRDLLAELARRSRGSVRCRVLAVLAFVLSSNDEGSLAYHCLARAREELDSNLAPRGRDDITGDMVAALTEAHQTGETRMVLQSVLIHALNFTSELYRQVQDHRYFECEECEAGFPELCEEDCVDYDDRADVWDQMDLPSLGDFRTREALLEAHARQAVQSFGRITPDEREEANLDGLEWAAINNALNLPEYPEAA